MPRGTLPLIFGLRQKFIYQNLAKNFRKVIRKSQIDRFKKKSIFNSRRGGYGLVKYSVLDLLKNSQ